MIPAQGLSAARTLRLQKVRETSISASALLDRQHREPQPLAPLHIVPKPRRKPRDDLAFAALLDDASEAPPTKKKSAEELAALERASARSTRLREALGHTALRRLLDGGGGAGAPRGWRADAMLFGELGTVFGELHGAMEVLTLRDQQGLASESAAANRARAAAFSRSLDAQQCGDLQLRIFERLDAAISTLRASFERAQLHLDGKRVFNGNANAQRIQTRYLAALRRQVRVRDVEAACVAEMMGGAFVAEDRPRTGERREPRGEPPRTPGEARTLDGAGPPRGATYSEADLFEGFQRWQAAKERNAKHAARFSRHGAAGLAPLPATALLAQTFANFGSSDVRLIGGKIELDNAKLLCAPAENRATGGAHRTKGATVTPFANTFAPPPPEPSSETASHDGAATAASIANSTLATRSSFDDESAVTDSEAPADSEAAPVGSAPRSRSRPATRPITTQHADADGLQHRLEKLWFDLQVPMQQKLAFLQKYASVQHAPLLLRAVAVWEAAAHVVVRRARLRRLGVRLRAGETFSGPDFVGLVSDVVSPDALPVSPPADLGRPGTIVTAKGAYDALDGVPPEAVVAPASDAPEDASWLGAVIAHYGAKCAECALIAREELDDAIPSTDFR
ncbi:hypothetical protein M885DRAFT_548918 [Pelagophyceae sp. CCMP2097]|nr:hypothetical protein M885DRAFT_548918 [Pelagophyceae sp. CCMP2097]